MVTARFLTNYTHSSSLNVNAETGIMEKNFSVNRMNKLFSIREIAQLLNVPAPTLRFWEEKGLFSVKKGANRYRQYTVRDLMRIANVIFFRNLGIPVSNVHEMEECTLEQYTRQIEEVQLHLKQRIRSYGQMYRRTQNQLQHLEAVQQLMLLGTSEEEVPFDAVATFDYFEQDKLIQYVQDPSCYVRYFNTKDMSTEVRSIIVSSSYSGQNLIWKKCPGTHFITFLIREKVDRDYESDVIQTLTKLQTRYQTGCLLARYLLTAKEGGERIDYLKAYLEVELLSGQHSEKE